MEAIKVNLIPNGIPEACHASQYDEGRQIRLDLFNGLTPYTIQAGDTFTLNVRKPDNHVITQTVTGTEGNTYLVIDTTEQMTAVAGENLCEIRVTNGADNIGSLNFIMQVEKDVIANGIPSESVIEDLDALINESLADLYDGTSVLFDDTPTENNGAPHTVTSEGIMSAIKTALINYYEQKLTQTLYVGQNVLTEQSVVLGSNWTGDLANGFTHTTGSTDPLVFNLSTENNKAYLVTFNATNVSNALALAVKIGDTPDVDIYNGTTDFYIGIVSDGGNLIITPKSTYNGTITNLKLREVTDEGDEVIFNVKNVNTKENQSGISGFWNVALGVDNFSKNENGSRNVAVGYASLNAFKSGARNLAIGTFAMNRLESGDMNIAVGADSMWYAKKAKDCIAFGANSMNGVGTDLEHDIAIGQDAMGAITTGKSNIAIGYGSMATPQTTGVNNSTCVGVQSGNYVNSGCTYIGQRAGYHLKGIYNTCLGLSAGAQQNTTGERNLFIGIRCGIDNTGATSSNPKTVNDSIAIGYQARATKNNQMVLGSSDITEVVMCGNKKIIFNNDGTVTWEEVT